jgi:hypothetical protein
MSSSFLTPVIITLCVYAVSAPQVHAREEHYQEVQYQGVSTMLPGTWSSTDGKPFAYTFYPNGTYVYVGSMGGAGLSTQISERGIYTVSGTDVTIKTVDGLITSSNGYKQPLEPETTVGRVGLVNTQSGRRMVLAFPDGRAFYK